MKRLSLETFGALPADVARPGYDPARIATGFVHFGPGAFHRAHQAAYIDRLLADDPRWGIAAVSLRTPETVAALARQDGLYSLSILDREPAIRVIGAHRSFIGPGGGARLHALLADPGVRIVTSTVTEKGYCLGGDGTLDFAHPDIVHDLAGTAEPRSLVGWIVAGLQGRHAAGTAPFAVLCCDNLSGNGTKLRAAAMAFARRSDPGLADWIAGEVPFPDTMVDSITPASDASLRAQVAGQLGVEDKAAVQRENFAQWVIADFPMTDGPDLASAGVTITSDVAGYERAKLRVLNGAHSTLAYLGLARGHQSVAEAMADTALTGFVERLVRRDIIASLTPVRGLDLDAYAGSVFERFRNPAIRHLLSQIAGDGSQKLPHRLLGTIADALAAGRPIARLAVPIAAWMAFVRRRGAGGEAVADPLGDTLAAIGAGSERAADLADRLLALRQVFPADLASDRRVREAILVALDAILDGNTEAVLRI